MPESRQIHQGVQGRAAARIRAADGAGARGAAVFGGTRFRKLIKLRGSQAGVLSRCPQGGPPMKLHKNMALLLMLWGGMAALPVSSRGKKQAPAPKPAPAPAPALPAAPVANPADVASPDAIVGAL